MARAPIRSSIIASFSPTYLDSEKMPWTAVKEQLDLSFDSSQRTEIYACFTEYETEFAFIEQAPTRAAVETLEADLKLMLQEISSLSERIFAEPESLRVKDYSDDAKAFDFLCLSFDRERSLRENMSDIRTLAEKVKSTLASKSMASRAPVALAPRTAALAKFIDEALNGDVNERPARTNPSLSLSFGPVEYSRWGLPIGPKSTAFASFMSILTGDEVTVRMVERAFETARQNANDRHPIFGNS